MSGATGHRKLGFGPFELSIGERVLRRDGQALSLGGRALDILIYLAGRPGEVIAKQELIDHVWSDVTVVDGSLRVHMAAIRKALGDGQFGNRYIANVKGRGYSFIGSVVRLEEGAEHVSGGPTPEKNQVHTLVLVFEALNAPEDRVRVKEMAGDDYVKIR